MREKTLFLAAVLLLLISFFSYNADFTGQGIRGKESYGHASHVKGDVNGDGRLDYADAQELERRLHPLIPVDVPEEHADVDGNGYVDQADLEFLRVLLAEKAEKSLFKHKSSCTPPETRSFYGRGGIYDNSYVVCKENKNEPGKTYFDFHDVRTCPHGEEYRSRRFLDERGISRYVGACVEREPTTNTLLFPEGN